jgi:cellulose biosynthesis protein BcsQ
MWFGQCDFERVAYQNGKEPDEVLAEALRRLLTTIEHSYDFVLFDCPPGFPTLSRAALLVSDAILSPTIADQVSMRSLKDFQEIAVNRLGISRDLLYVLVTKFVANNSVHKHLLDRLRRDYRVVGSPIKFSVDIMRATERSSNQSKRTFNEKYKLQTNAVKSLGRAFVEAIGKGLTRHGRAQSDQPRRGA